MGSDVITLGKVRARAQFGCVCPSDGVLENYQVDQGVIAGLRARSWELVLSTSEIILDGTERNLARCAYSGTEEVIRAAADNLRAAILRARSAGSGRRIAEVTEATKVLVRLCAEAKANDRRTVPSF